MSSEHPGVAWNASLAGQFRAQTCPAALEALRTGSVLAAWHGPGSSTRSACLPSHWGSVGWFVSGLEGVLRSRREQAGNRNILVLSLVMPFPQASGAEEQLDFYQLIC